MDDDDYLYQVDFDHEFIYCFAYNENCARAGIIDFITPFNISNAQVFSKPHKHLLLGLYC